MPRLDDSVLALVGFRIFEVASVGAVILTVVSDWSASDPSSPGDGPPNAS